MNVAEHFGYAARCVYDSTMETMYAMLRAGHPVLVCFDVDVMVIIRLFLLLCFASTLCWGL